MDSSWITLFLQDDSGGLEVCTGGGEWLDVNVGKILEFASRGSHPFFLNPGLASTVEWAPVKALADRGADFGHIHRVFPGIRQEGFVFGQQTVETDGPGHLVQYERQWLNTTTDGLIQPSRIVKGRSKPITYVWHQICIWRGRPRKAD